MTTTAMMGAREDRNGEPARAAAAAIRADIGRHAAPAAGPHGDVQRIVAPGGDILVVMSLAHYRRLARAAPENDGLVPAAVRDAIALGETPLAAWRRHRGYSQTSLAAIAAVSRATINRLEQRDAGAGHRESRTRLARALDVPLGAL